MKIITLLPIIIVLSVGILIGSSYIQDYDDQESLHIADTSSPIRYSNITAQEFKTIYENQDVFIIDTHTPEQAHIEGTDEVIPYNEIEAHANLLPTDKQASIVVYCRSGSMSTTAAQTLVNLGYTNVQNLIGGKVAFDELETPNSDQIIISPSTRDLGEVIYGDVAETLFTISNDTDQEIAITRVTTSCGCTKAYPEKDHVQVGETIDMKVTFDPAVHGDATDVGVITRTIYVETDHHDFPKLEVTITGEVLLKD